MKKMGLGMLVALSWSAMAQNFAPTKNEAAISQYGWNSVNIQYEISDQSVTIKNTSYVYCYNHWDHYRLKQADLKIDGEAVTWNLEPMESSSVPLWVKAWTTWEDDGDIVLHVESETTDPVATVLGNRAKRP